MPENNAMLPIGMLLLGGAAITAFIAFRPWPATPENKPIKPGAYVVEVLQGRPPAASVPQDKSSQITEIQNGLMALILVYAVSKIAGGITGVLGLLGMGGGE